ncbi:MAG TPA: cob(I)yrinic acid a,c-diamide adenosyltransferase [Bacillota bacterium]|nr:cob(I)yrinic acid a,c-diamide adenosyltransferase [Bacillota bacterium]HOR86650.1 cob(I)yrinic acid a,c-diamide adenosyltransferase [Bacillota bacterium]HPL53380.1 cob(I)yrinic acid a,c-diamide adenosyltransferase [Bacillota bacterium]
MRLKKGLIQVYTGDGKGKTTAALGQGLRSCGRGLKVYMVQFLKGSDTGELHSVEKLNPLFKIFRFEKERGFFWTLSEQEKKELKEDIDRGFAFIEGVVANNECDVLIIDELLGVLGNKLIKIDQVLKLLKTKPESMEIIITGRNAPKEIIDAADLVTEMREIKHYFKSGIPAREGIES